MGVATGQDAYRTSLLALYVLNNFILNTSGIVVLKLGGASLTAILYAVLLPLRHLHSAPRSSGNIKNRSWRQL